MALIKSIATSFEINDQPVNAEYWVVTRIEVEFYNQILRASLSGYNKKSGFTKRKRILDTRNFEWFGNDTINGFPFTKSGNIEHQVQLAIIAYKSRNPSDGQPTIVEFAGAIEE